MIAYFLGAGASAEFLPLVGNFFDLNKFNPYSAFKASRKSMPEDDINLYEAILSDFETIVNGVYGTWSIDTYANMLFHSNPRMYNVLKAFLSSYLFTLENSFGVDKRYDLFFSSIRTGFDKLGYPKYRVPVSIISWNYDIQFERAISKHFQQWPIERTIDEILGSNDLSTLENYQIPYVKLNGSIAGNNSFHNGKVDFRKKDLRLSPIEYFFSLYLDIFQEMASQREIPITFSWDTNQVLEKRISYAKEIILKSEFIVIVGYSFPDFNRDIDSEIFEKIKTGTRVFVQCNSKHQNDFENLSIIRRLREYMPIRNPRIEIEAINDNSRFFIPIYKK